MLFFSLYPVLFFSPFFSLFSVLVSLTHMSCVQSHDDWIPQESLNEEARLSFYNGVEKYVSLSLSLSILPLLFDVSLSRSLSVAFAESPMTALLTSQRSCSRMSQKRGTRDIQAMAF